MAYKKIDQYDHDVTQGLMKNYRDTLNLLGEVTGQTAGRRPEDRRFDGRRRLRGGLSVRGCDWPERCISVGHAAIATPTHFLQTCEPSHRWLRVPTAEPHSAA